MVVSQYGMKAVNGDETGFAAIVDTMENIRDVDDSRRAEIMERLLMLWLPRVEDWQNRF